MQQKRRRASWILLALQLYALLCTIVYLRWPQSALLGCLSPLAFLSQFLETWFAPAAVIVLLCCLPLLGWLLLYRAHTFGLYLIRAVHILLLAANAVITPMHFISDIGVLHSPKALGVTMLLCLSNLLHSVLCLVFLSRWKPNTKF